jgi:uncharacterized protein YijF (DUF1287 family)
MHFKNLFPLLFLTISSLVVGQTEYGLEVAAAAEELTKDQVIYNGSYFNIPYPNGDVPKLYGVCTGVIIRVHEDMKAHLSKYPLKWGLKKTDTNIDHRRVPNLRTFFTRKGRSLDLSQQATDYLPGDAVSRKLSSGLTHIGVVSKTKSKDQKRYLMVHNIGAG